MPDFAIERGCAGLVCGVDEAGRGPLAGPVYAAAVILNPARRINGLADSKILAPERRGQLAERIKERAIAWSVASASVEEIDRLNIFHAAMLAMRTGRPVKMTYGREESFFGHVHRHPAWMRYEHGANRDGRLVYVKATIVLDGGAYASSSRAVCLNAASTAVGPYRCPSARVEAILGHKGALAASVYKVTIGRTARMHDQEVGATMGVNTWAAFAGSDEKAVVDGDFAMRESELQAVLRALRRAGIDIVAIHHHMAEEQPRILFLHYWGVGKAEDLARGLRSALDLTRDSASSR